MKPKFPRSWWRASAPGALIAVLSGALLGGASASDASAGTVRAGDPHGDRHGDGRDSRRVVAVGDVHGSLDGIRSILREAGLIDAEDRWSGGDALLVQTGDLLDRGPHAIEVAEFMMRLQAEAPRTGGEIIVLLGNHEALNFLGDRGDVHEATLESLTDRHSEKRLASSCKRFVDFHRRLAEKWGQEPTAPRELQARCRAEQQVGLAEYIEELGPEGRVGRWLRSLPAVTRVGEVVFVHGGIAPKLAGLGLEEINREVRQEIECLDRARRWLVDQELALPTSRLPELVSISRELKRAIEADPEGKYALPPDLDKLIDVDNWLLVRADGPLWFRGYALWDEEDGEARIPEILEALDAAHVVAAHTPQRPSAIGQRFDSQVFLIDTGMLTSVYRGRPSALEIQNGRFTAIYASQKKVLFEGALAAAD